MKHTYNIYYVSMGAPSLTMLLRALKPELSNSIEEFSANYPDEVVYINLGFEYPQVASTAVAVKELCSQSGIAFTQLDEDMWHLMLKAAVSRKRPKDAATNYGWKGFTQRLCQGYGWCGGRIRWGTALKRRAISKHLLSVRTALAKEYGTDNFKIRSFVGFSYEEICRSYRPFMCNAPHCVKFVYPLITAQLTKPYCISYVTQEGYPVGDLYKLGLTHIGCWCCRNHNIREIVAMRQKLPEVYSKLRALEAEIKEPYYRSPRGWACLDDIYWQRTKFMPALGALGDSK